MLLYSTATLRADAFTTGYYSGACSAMPPRVSRRRKSALRSDRFDRGQEGRLPEYSTRHLLPPAIYDALIMITLLPAEMPKRRVKKSGRSLKCFKLQTLTSERPLLSPRQSGFAGAPLCRARVPFETPRRRRVPAPPPSPPPQKQQRARATGERRSALAGKG